MIVVIGVLLAAGIMSRAVSRVEDSTLALKRSGSRAMAWSGVQAAMATIASQRELLLMGGDVNLTDSRAWEYADTDGPGVWTVTLLPLDAAGNTSFSETACVNVNTASEAQLAKMTSLGPTGAAAIMGRRARGPILAIEQVSMPGPLTDNPASDRSTSEAGASPSDQIDFGSSVPDAAVNSGEASSDHPLQLTALSADATVMLADGKTVRYRASDVSGKDIPAEITAEQDERLGEGASAARTWAKRPIAELTLSHLVADLEADNVPATAWGKVLDAIEPSEDLFVLGRIDINRADEATLATLPGVDLELASNLVRVRATLDESGRRDLAWPVVSGATDAKVFAGIVDLITTRTMQYRVRVQAGRTVRQDATGVESDEFGVAKGTDAPVTDRCVFEAVIDVAGDVPRIAYLRDITLLDSAAMVADVLADVQQSRGMLPLDPTEAGADMNSDPAMDEPGPDPAASESDTPPDVSSDGVAEADLETEGLRRSGGLDLGGGLERVGGLGLDREQKSDVNESSQSERPVEKQASPSTGTSTRADPRLGRWNTSTPRTSQTPSSENAATRSGANDAVRGAGSQDAAKPSDSKPGSTSRTKPQRKAGSK